MADSRIDRTAPPGRLRGSGLLPLALLGSCFCAVAAGYSFFTIDDAFISFRYAANAARGLGLVFNPGEHVAGYTNFLWTAMLAGLARIGLAPYPWAKVLGALAGLLCVLATWRSAARGSGPVAGWIAGALLATSGIFALNAVEGLETPLFALLLLCALTPPWRLRRAGPRVLVQGSLFGLLALTRPDGAAFLVLLPWSIEVASDEAGDPGPGDRARPGRWLLAALPAAIMVLGFGLWHHAFYGDWLPNTWHAKAAQGPVALRAWTALWSDPQSLRNFVIATGLLPLYALFQAARVRGPGARGARLLAGAVLLRWAFHLWSGGAFMGTFRFLAPTLPLTCVLVGRAVVAPFELPDRRRSRAALVTVLAVGLLSNAATDYLVAKTRGEIMDGCRRAHWRLAETMRDSGWHGVIALGDVGAIPYFSGVPAIDLWGITDAHVARRPGAFYAKLAPDYVLGRRPDAIVLVSRSAPDEPFRAFTPAEDAIYRYPGFRRGYDRIAVLAAARDYLLWVFEARGRDGLRNALAARGVTGGAPEDLGRPATRPAGARPR